VAVARAEQIRRSAHPIVEQLVALKFCDVFDGCGGNVPQCLAREKSLMASDNYVWESEQPREDIVRNDQAGAILEKDLLFFLVNIETEIADLAV
jgi:hypothetical protein